MPFEKGNQLAANDKRWKAAINKALERRTASRRDKLDALDALAEKFLDAVENGGIAEFRELGYRLDGRPSQHHVLSGDEENPIQTVSAIKLIPINGSDNKPTE